MDRVGSADEVDIAPVRPDGTFRPYTTIWVVCVADDLYVRSYRGPSGAWYRAAQGSHLARLRAGAVEPDISLEEASGASKATVDAAYRSNYGRSLYIDAMLSGAAAATTMRACPR